MKTRQMVPALTVLLGVMAVQKALAFYNPQTGRWLSRDPVHERGGLNVYSFAANSLWEVDPTGLASVRFEVVRGSILGMSQGAGEWSQPFWAGSGEYYTAGDWAMSSVSINNGSSPFDLIHYSADYCNTVWHKDPAGEDKTVGHSGTIKTYLKDECGGWFRVTGLYTVTVSGAGPGNGNRPSSIYGTAYLRSASANLSFEATQSQPLRIALVMLDMRVCLKPDKEKLIVEHEPVMGFVNRGSGGTSYGTVEALVSISSIERTAAQ